MTAVIDDSGAHRGGRALAPMTAAQSTAEALLRAALAPVQQYCPASEVVAVMDTLRQKQLISHRDAWRPFALAYALANYRKALTVLRLLDLGRYDTTLDVGAGFGASALAVLTHAAESNTPVEELVLVDRAGEPLTFALPLARSATRALRLSTRVTARESDLYDRNHGDRHHRLVIASHLLCETTLRASASDTWSRLLELVAEGGFAVVIDRCDEPVGIAEAKRRHTTHEWHSGRVSIDAPAPVAASDARVWNCEWYLAKAPHAWMRSLITEYFNAWVHKCVNKLPTIFRADAIYHEKPFSDPMVGLEAITQYWLAVVSRQRSTEIEIHNCVYAKMSATVEWKARLVEDTCYRDVKGLLVLHFDPAAKRVSRLVEVFRTVERTRS